MSTVSSACRCIAFLVIGLVIVATGCERGLEPLVAAGVTDQLLRNAQSRPDVWVHYGRNYAAWRYAPIEQINRETVGRLELKWKLDAPGAPDPAWRQAHCIMVERGGGARDRWGGARLGVDVRYAALLGVVLTHAPWPIPC